MENYLIIFAVKNQLRSVRGILAFFALLLRKLGQIYSAAMYSILLMWALQHLCTIKNRTQRERKKQEHIVIMFKCALDLKWPRMLECSKLYVIAKYIYMEQTLCEANSVPGKIIEIRLKLAFYGNLCLCCPLYKYMKCWSSIYTSFSIPVYSN